MALQKASDQHCEYGHLKTEMARPNLQFAAEVSSSPACVRMEGQSRSDESLRKQRRVAATRIAKSVMNIVALVAQNIRMKAALVHAVQPVHEVQDLRPPSPLPRDLCQLSKNHMWGDAQQAQNGSELQKLTEKGNLQARHPLQPGPQITRAEGAPDYPDLTAI